MPSAPVPADVKCAQPSLSEVSGLRLTPAPLTAAADKARTSPSGSWAEMSEEEGAFGMCPASAPWAEMSDEEDFIVAPPPAKAKSARTPLSGKAKPFVLAGAAADVVEDAALAQQRGTPPDDAVGCGAPEASKRDQDATAADGGARSACTSLILRNVPYAWTRDKLVEVLNSTGFSEAYDFVYVPVDLKSMNSLGYAFVNLSDPCHVDRFMNKFQNFDDWQCDVCKTKCRVSFSRTQKLSGYIRRFQDSAIMNASVPDECKPAIFSNGVRMPFPEPTKTLRELNSVYKPQFGQRRNKLSMKY